MVVLYEHSEQRLADLLRFEAAVHGLKLKSDPGRNQAEAGGKKGFVFGDPDSYKDMSQADREALTQKMMGQHQMWVMEKKPMGGKKARMG